MTLSFGIILSMSALAAQSATGSMKPNYSGPSSEIQKEEEHLEHQHGQMEETKEVQMKTETIKRKTPSSSTVAPGTKTHTHTTTP